MADENVTDTQTEEQKASEAAAAAAAQGATGDEAEAGKKKEGEKPDAAAEKVPEKSEEEKKRDRDAYERRKERKRLHDLELEVERLRGFKEATEKGGKTAHEDTAPDAAAIEAEYAAKHPEPKEDDFKTWGEFNKAHTRWAVGLAKFEDSKTSERTTEDTGKSTLKKMVDDQRSKGEQEFEDYSEVMDDLVLPVTMMRTIYESPDGHKLAYYLGQNPKEQERISALPPYLQAKELGKIESKIESGAIQLKKPVSKAPAPAPIPGAKGPGSGDISPDMDMEAYAARRTAGAKG